MDLKEDNLKKAIHIAQLERERRSGQVRVKHSKNHARPNFIIKIEIMICMKNCQSIFMVFVCSPNDYFSQVVPDEETIENSEQGMENEQETIQEEELVDNTEQTVVIEESQESAIDVIESGEAVENAVYQQEVCDTPMTVNVQTGETLTEAHTASESIQESLQNTDVVSVNAHAIIVSQAVVEEQL